MSSTALRIAGVILVLLTYFFGDAVAQGFLHQAAGLVLFILTFVVNSAARAVVAGRTAK